jgi:hypothetical protein
MSWPRSASKAGGKKRGEQLRGDSAWGRRMLAARGGNALHSEYPELTRLWALRGTRARWGGEDVKAPEVLDVSESVLRRRTQRDTKRRRAAYDKEHGL